MRDPIIRARRFLARHPNLILGDLLVLAVLGTIIVPRLPTMAQWQVGAAVVFMVVAFVWAVVGGGAAVWDIVETRRGAHREQ